jgi:DNA-binding IclR family transcriptional regulator
VSDNKYRIDTVYTACQILEAVANSKEPIGAAEIAKTLGINANMAFRQCCTLEERGILQMVGDKKFDLGMKLAIFWARKKSRLQGERDTITRNLEELEVEEGQQ